MPREIKFRAWNGKEMQLAFDLSQNPKFWWVHNKDYPLMQFTGLLDKNGKEIYEGDLIHGAEGGHLSEVFFNEGYFQLRHNHYDMSGNITGVYEQVLGWLVSPLEVVGNIYENKELLK